MGIKFEWEQISKTTWRAKVKGGWLVNHKTMHADSCSESMVFIPDTHYAWDVDHEQ